VVFAVPCSETDKLLKNEFWVAAKELYWKAPCKELSDTTFTQTQNVYHMGKELRESLLLDKNISAQVLKRLFENQMKRNSIREPFLLS
jgi:hypothetical protein